MLDVIIVGAGPAGIGLLSAIFRAQLSSPVSPLNLCLLDMEDSESFGRIGRYDINSDTRAEKFLTCLDGLPAEITSAPTLATLTQNLRSYGANAAPLHLVGAFYRALGQELCREMTRKGQIKLRPQTLARSATRHSDHWQVEITSNGGVDVLSTRHLVLACGATESSERFKTWLNPYALKIDALSAFALSSEILSANRGDIIFEKLRPLDAPKVSIIGGSHSAMSAAAKLLDQSLPFDTDAITIFHRSALRVTFDSAEDAVQQGFTDFSPHDICPHSHRVHALKGFRLDSRELLCAIKGYGGRPLETRVKLTEIPSLDTETLRSELLKSDLVISALGYHPDYIDLYDGNTGETFLLNNPNFVDQHSRLLSRDGTPIPGAYALGLASNYNLAGRFGEASFTGQANGLVLWHKDIGTELASVLSKGSGHGSDISETR